MLANSGERIPPCGVPVIVSRLRPSSVRTPAFKNAFTQPRTRLSPIRPRTRPIRPCGSISSKRAPDIRLRTPPGSPWSVIRGSGSSRDRALWSALRGEAVGARPEVRLEDRLEHQLQRGLHDPVCDSRDPQRTDSATRLGDRLLPHPLRNEPASFEIISQPSEQSCSTEHDGAGCHHPSTPRRSCALVAPHPTPRHNEECRVIHEVGKVIEATARIGLAARTGAASSASQVPGARPLCEVGPRERRYSPASSSIRS